MSTQPDRPSGDRPLRQRAALRWGLALAGLALLVVPTVLLVSARGSRKSLEAQVALLQRQATQDRRSRLALEKAIVAERHRIAEATARREDVEALRVEEGRIREALEEARDRAAATSAEIEALQARLAEDQQELQAVRDERSRAERLIRANLGGVGLIESSYGFVDAAGRPVRRAAREGEGAEPAGEGEVATLDFLGTGFLVSASGHVLTNRHVAEPWWEDAKAEELTKRGLRPVLTRFRIFFPGVPEPFDLKVVSVSTKADVALARASLGRRKVPVLELAKEAAPAASGQPVVLLGYPAGLDTLVARLDADLLRSTLATAGAGDDELTVLLARQRMIRPLATQGHLGDVLPHQLVYDAQTTVGGSGGPVFDARGRVIGVNAAILTDFSGASFGVPISFGLELLRDATATPAARRRRKRTGRTPSAAGPSPFRDSTPRRPARSCRFADRSGGRSVVGPVREA